MGTFTIKASAETPPSSLKWETDNGDDLKQQLVYTNLAYDIMAVAMAKLGWEYSKWVLGEQTECEMNTALKPVFDAANVK